MTERATSYGGSFRYCLPFSTRFLRIGRHLYSITSAARTRSVGAYGQKIQAC